MTPPTPDAPEYGAHLFHAAHARRRQIRKSGGTPAPLPHPLELVEKQCEIDVLKSVLAEDPAAMERAIIEAALQAYNAAVAKVQAEFTTAAAPVRPTRQEAPMETTTVEAFISKSGGHAWQAITTAATKSAQRGETPEAAVTRYLQTAEGRKAYAAYNAEQETVTQKHAQSRLAPPDRGR